MIGNEKTIESAKEADARKENYVYYVIINIASKYTENKTGTVAGQSQFCKKHYASAFSFFLARYSLIVNTSQIANKITMMESTAINL